MNQSSEIKDLAGALVKAQAQLKPASKDGMNPHFKSPYATLQSVWGVARAALTPNGLAVSQTFTATDGDTLAISTTLMHTSGQWIGGTLTIKPTKADPQGIGSAITYGRRYALAAILGIVADEDDDGNAASAPRHTEPARTVSRPIAQARQESFPGDPSQADWRDCPVPAFIKGKGATLGEMKEADLRWWAANYVPKPFKGSIPPGDQDFRDALDAAQLDFQP